MLLFMLVVYNLAFLPALGNNVLDEFMLKCFLESQYVPEAGLLRAAVTAYPDNETIYVANDNVLAARALEVLGSPLAEEVLATLNNKYNGGWNGKIDVLFGRDIQDQFYSSYIETLGYTYSSKFNTTFVIAFEKLNTSSPIINWRDYADLIVYKALDKLLSGSRLEAEQLFLKLVELWNGYGFYDRQAREKGVYAVYKIALAVFLYRALKSSGSNIPNQYRDLYDKWVEIIAMAQDPVYGGIHTDYVVEKDAIKITGDMNVETTSMVVLALYSDYPRLIGEHARDLCVRDCSSYLFSLLLILLFLGLLASRVLESK